MSLVVDGSEPCPRDQENTSSTSKGSACLCRMNTNASKGFLKLLDASFTTAVVYGHVEILCNASSLATLPIPVTFPLPLHKGCVGQKTTPADEELTRVAYSVSSLLLKLTCVYLILWLCT